MPRAYGVSTRQADTIVVWCSDHRLQKTFYDFVMRELGLENGQFFLVSVAGGGFALSEPTLKEDFDGAKWQIEFFLHHSNIKRIVLIGHADCTFYRVMGLQENQPRHYLLSAKRQIECTFPNPNIAVDLFYGEFCGGNMVFRPVHEPQLQRA